MALLLITRSNNPVTDTAATKVDTVTGIQTAAATTATKQNDWFAILIVNGDRVGSFFVAR